MALITWLIPSAHTSAHTETQLIFEIDESLNKPKPLPVYAPTILSNPTRPKQPSVKKPTRGQSGRYNVCSCVSYAKSKTGFAKSIGYAKYWPINSQTPVAGAVVITAEGKITGHVAYVEAVNGETITISEANFVRCKVTTRTIPINNSVIRGYYVP